MLILSRKLGESVIVADEIVIRIVELRRSRVRIGIEAPLEISIRRGELVDEAPFRLASQIGKTEDLTLGEGFELNGVSHV
jgi:carbon storage regulator